MILGNPSRWVVAIFLFISLAVRVMAHGDLHERIAGLTIQLNQQTNNARLYLERAELHRLHGEWASALTDFDLALQLNPALEMAEIGRGKVLLAANRPKLALEALEKFLKRYPDHAEARLAYARSLEGLNRHIEAAENFSKAIDSCPEPMPDYYLERMRALVSAGKVEEALKGLDAGMNKLGKVVSLQLPAIELEMQRKDFDAALARLRTLADGSPRKETWAAKYGEIYEAAGRIKEAWNEYAKGLSAIEMLPPARRNTRMMKDLEERLRNGIKRTELRTGIQPYALQD